jgi:hypothetical protein
MDFMIKLLLSTTILASALSLQAQAAERFYLSTWEKSFKSSVKTAADAEKALNTSGIEKQYLSLCTDCDNKDAMKQARTVYAKGNYDEAIRLYNEIPRGNDYWMNAVEEKGWAYFRQDDFEKSLAQTKTLLSPQLSETANSEAYLLRSLSLLKICDYKEIFANHQNFKEKQKAKILEIQNLAETGYNDTFKTVILKSEQFPLDAKELGDGVKHLPTLFFKDKELQKQLLRFKMTAKAQTLIEQDANLNSPKLLAKVDSLNTEALKQLKNRMKVLAQEETNANFKIIQKINLVEVEAIQRVHADQELTDSSFKKSNFKKTNEDQLVFMDDGNPWIDELDKFEVSSKSCVKGIRRKM